MRNYWNPADRRELVTRSYQPAPREIDQHRGEATPPHVFAHDRDAPLALIHGFTPATVRGRSHPLWGQMSDWEWGRWGYLHTDHHLRQFGA
jgi:hypothetical protein